MTRDEILALPAGPELDRLVAEKVLGSDVVRLDGDDGWWVRTGQGFNFPVTRYSTEWGAMRLVVEWAVKVKGWSLDIYRCADGCCDNWNVRFSRPAPEGGADDYYGDGRATTLPHAVCLAALLIAEAAHE